jgi:hypothetical protein
MIGPAELEDLLLDLRAAATEDGATPSDAFHPEFWRVAEPEPSRSEAPVESGLEAH